MSNPEKPAISLAVAGPAERGPAHSLRLNMLTGELPPDSFQRVVAATQRHRYQPGQLVFQQGDLAEHFFLVEQGEIKLYRLSAEGQEKIIDMIRPGETFAEAVIFTSQLGYPVHAEAVRATTLLAIPARVYLEELLKSPQSCMNLLARMSRRLHQQVQEIDRLTLHSATYRLLHLLLDEIPSHQQHAERVTIRTPKHLIASRLAISPETLSRLLGKLRRQGLIENHKNEIVLLDVAEIRRYFTAGE